MKTIRLIPLAILSIVLLGIGAFFALPATALSPTYTLQGPGLSAAEAIIPRADKQTELALTHAVVPGNYSLIREGKRIAGFSLIIAPEESMLARVPAEQIGQVLGDDALLPVERSTSLHEALQGHWSQPVELFPTLMILVLLALAIENLLANKFYRQEGKEEDRTQAAEHTGEAGEQTDAAPFSEESRPGE